MKTKILFTALVLGLGLTLALLWLLNGPVVRAADLTVCPGGGCDYTTIQAAVDAANDGDVIRVAQGNYTDLHLRGGITQVVYISKTVTVRGGYTTAFTEPPDPDTHPTTLDAGGLGRGLVINGPITVSVEGLRITGGDATGLGDDIPDAGGGVYVVTATITLLNNWVYSNTAPVFGGGLYFHESDATLTGNMIYSNTSQGGGGLFLYYSDAVLSGNLIYNNTASGGGGGLFLYNNNATLSGNVISGNDAASGGGGLGMFSSDAILTNNVVVDNRAGMSGAGIYIEASRPRLSHTTIARNTGGDGSGVYVTEFDP